MLGNRSGVIAAVRHMDLFGHLLDPHTPFTTWEDRPQPPPPWPANPTLEDVYAARRWSMDDATVTFVLCGCLGDQACLLIPPPTSPAHLRTTFIIYTKLVRFFGVWDYQECSDILDAMSLVRCKHGQAEVN